MNEPNPTNSNLPAIDMVGVAAGAMRNFSFTVVSDVNWTVRSGEFWVLAGPQRSGKTDFLMMTGGLMAPKRGSYRFFGNEMPIFDDSRLAERLKLGFVFDGGQLFNQMTIAENVSLPLRYHSNLSREKAQEQIQALLEAVELAPLAHNTPATVGRSFQKRAGLARALTLQPEVLLLDNPLSGLDARHTLWWVGFLRQLSRGHELLGGKPLTIAATADDLRPWRGSQRRFACLSNERFLVLGNWSEVERCPEPAVQDLLHQPPPVIDRQEGI